MGIGIARLVSREWEGMKTPHFSICHPQVADNQTLLMDLCFCIVLDVHETLLAPTLHVRLIFRFITGLFRLLLSLPVVCYLIEILLVVRQWEREGMGITSGNGKGMGIKLG